MSKQSSIIVGDEIGGQFEQLAQTNGATWWYYSDLLQVLGYQTITRTPLVKAQQACLTLDIDTYENFIPAERTVDGRVVHDYKLSRFACYLTALNADSRKKQVARAQVYFVKIAESIRHYIEEVEGVQRVLDRRELSLHQTSIASVVKQRGIADSRGFADFQRAGYRGMYNLSSVQLKTLKGLEGPELRRSILDFMSSEELAANRFRITQTEAKIKNEDIYGQGPLEVAAESVGRQVRQTMIDISGNRPEDLPLAEDIQLVKRRLKGTAKRLRAIDSKK